MMWLGVYQSARCWLLSGPCTSPTQSFTVPQVQIGLRPIHEQDRRHHRDQGEGDRPNICGG